MLSINELSTNTECGYSYDSFTPSGWKSAIRVLRSKGLNDEQIEVFMLSKHTRWAGDGDEKRRFGSYNGNTMREYLGQDWDIVQEVNNMINGVY